MKSTLQTTVFASLLLAASLTATAATPTTTPPARLFDLSHFKLTLPVDASGKITGTAQTIPNSALVGSPGYMSKFFYSDTDGAMVFVAPTNGATTTPGSGSDHTRSELRELYRVNGPTEWTNAIGGSMSALCRVRKAAVKSDEAVIGQIHGLSSIMLILDYNAGKKQIEAKIYPSPTSSKAQVVVLASNVMLGAKIRYELQWIGSTLSISIDGKARNFTVASVWNGVPVYFKAGAYSSAPNTGNPANDETEVAFYSLYIQH